MTRQRIKIRFPQSCYDKMDFLQSYIILSVGED